MNEQTVRGVSRNGFTVEELAMSIYRVHCSIMDIPADWDGADHFAWDRLTTHAMKIIDDMLKGIESSDAQVKFSVIEFAKSLAAWSRREAASDVWQTLSVREQLAWEACVRHLVNCLDSEQGSVNVEKMEKDWPGWWLKKKIAQGAKL